MESKICSKCKEEKPVSEFTKNKAKKDGLSPQCRICKSKTAQKHYLKHTQKAKDRGNKSRKVKIKKWKDFKSVLSCERCEEDFSECLDFHHLDPKEKSFTISNAISRIAWDTIMKEVEKCVVLCKNCHTKEHYKLKTGL